MVLFIVLTFLVLGACAMAQKSDPCSQQEYKILTPTALGIRCIDDVSVLGILGGTGTLIFHGDSNHSQPNGVVKISFFTTENSWLLLTLSGASGRLEPGEKYTLSLTYSVKCTTACASGQTMMAASGSIDVDTTETVTISPSVVDSSPKSFKAKSTVGFSSLGNTLSFLERQKMTVETHSCTVSVLDGVNHVLSTHATCSTLKSLSSTSPTERELAGVDPEDVGIYDITLDAAPATPLIPGPLPLKTVFGNSPKIDPKSRFSPKKAPATKDASQYYINLNWAAGVGTVPAWVLDGQIAPRLWMSHSFAFGPVASADVGNNKLTGQTYTDTIDFGFTSQKPYFFQQSDRPLLQELLFVPGVKYETDKEFDRDNMLATADLRYNFAGLYRTQTVAALQKFYHALQQYQDSKASLPSGSTPPYVPQLDDFRPPLMGYALDFHTGIETGGALVDTTVHASTGKATQVLPTYSIFRLVPQVHGLLELWKFSFDANMTGRYLALTENTVLETPTHSLNLTKVQGWKGIGTLTNTFNLDSQGHVAINLVFKDGFAPPTYKRVNAVQGGVLLKY
jgi:hypothetical protein